MELGDRLGIIGLIVALVALGITIMWPTKRPIGYACFVVAFFLCAFWGVAEYRSSHKVEEAGTRKVVGNFPIPGGKSVGPPQSPSTKTSASQLRPFHIHITKREAHDPREGVLAMNIYFENDGDEQGKYVFAGVSILGNEIPDLSTPEGREKERLAEDILFTIAEHSITSKDAKDHEMQLEEHGHAWITLSNPGSRPATISTEQIKALVDQKAMAYSVGIWRYKSGKRIMETEACDMWNSDPRVVYSCIGHNGDHTVNE